MCLFCLFSHWQQEVTVNSFLISFRQIFWTDCVFFLPAKYQNIWERYYSFPSVCMGFISVREGFKTKGILFFWETINCLVKSWFSLGTWNGRDPWWTPWSRLLHCRHRQRCRWLAWNRTIYSVNFPFKICCLSNRDVLGSIFVLGGIAGQWTNFSAYPLGAGHLGGKKKEYEQIKKMKLK